MLTATSTSFVVFGITTPDDPRNRPISRLSAPPLRSPFLPASQRRHRASYKEGPRRFGLTTNEKVSFIAFSAFFKMSYASRQAADDGRLVYVGNLSDDVRERYVVCQILGLAPARFVRTFIRLILRKPATCRPDRRASGPCVDFIPIRRRRRPRMARTSAAAKISLSP